MHNTAVNKNFSKNSILIIPEDLVIVDDSTIEQQEDNKSKQSKKSNASRKSDKRRSSRGSKSIKKSKSRKETKTSSKRKSKVERSRPQATSDREQKQTKQESRAEPLMTQRKVIKKVSFADSDSIIETKDTIETGLLWWTRTELEGMAEESRELCSALKDQKEYFQALHSVYNDTLEVASAGDNIPEEQQEAMHILMNYDFLGRGLERQITLNSSQERIGQHRFTTLEAIYRVQSTAQASGQNVCECTCSRFVSGLSATFSRSSRNMAFIMARIDADHARAAYSES